MPPCPGLGHGAVVHSRPFWKSQQVTVERDGNWDCGKQKFVIATVLTAYLSPKPKSQIFAQSTHCLELLGAPARIQSSFKPSANDTAAPASFIFRAVNRAIRSPMLLLGTVWRLSKFAAQVFGKPSSSVNTTSVGILRIVEVIGAMVTEFGSTQ